MRDLLPASARARAELRRSLGELFALYGYEPVVTPVFELAEVIERGLDAVDRRDLLRFVEPDTGEVALLRPDITPQVARIVATSLSGFPAPYRLSYEGTVIRRRRGRARKQRQIFQVGGECIGPRGPAADVEVAELAARAAERAGLGSYRIELAQVRIARDALTAVPPEFRESIADALAAKDITRLEHELDLAKVPKRVTKRLVTLAAAYGPRAELRRARKTLGPDASPALDELEAVLDRLADVGIAGEVGVDLGELRGQAYYTGVSFTLLADGPGEPVGAGGRYDGLLQRFDADLPATGFAIDLENLEWAVRVAGGPARTEHTPRCAVRGGRAGVVVDALRRAGLPAIALTDADTAGLLAYATSWGYDCAVEASAKGLRATRLDDRETRTFASLDDHGIDAFVAWLGSDRILPGRN